LLQEHCRFTGDIAVIDVDGDATDNRTNSPGVKDEHPDWSL
jgi:hypothetical protein